MLSVLELFGFSVAGSLTKQLISNLACGSSSLFVTIITAKHRQKVDLNML